MYPVNFPCTHLKINLPNTKTGYTKNKAHDTFFYMLTLTNLNSSRDGIHDQHLCVSVNLLCFNLR